MNCTVSSGSIHFGTTLWWNISSFIWLIFKLFFVWSIFLRDAEYCYQLTSSLSLEAVLFEWNPLYNDFFVWHSSCMLRFKYLVVEDSKLLVLLGSLVCKAFWRLHWQVSIWILHVSYHSNQKRRGKRISIQL